MIKTKNGKLKLSGSRSDLYADLGVIIRHLVMEDIIALDEIHRLADWVPTIGKEADSCER